MVKYTEEQIIQNILERFVARRPVSWPLWSVLKGHYRELFEQIRKQGYTKSG